MCNKFLQSEFRPLATSRERESYVEHLGDLLESRGTVYSRYFLDIKVSGRRRLETHCLSKVETPPGSPRD